MGVEPKQTYKVEAAHDFATRMKATWDKAQAALGVSKDTMKHFTDERRKDAPVYKVGDKVWLNSEDLDIRQPTCKLGPKFLGPFSITKIINDNAVELQLPHSMQNHKVFNVAKLRPFNSPIPGQAPPPSPTPVITSTGAEYYMESLLDSRMFRGHLQYLVRWKGYDASEDTWEPKSITLSLLQGSVSR